MTKSTHSPGDTGRPKRRLLTAAWFAVVAASAPVALLAGWLGMVLARILQPVTNGLGLPSLGPSAFWAAALVPVGIVAVGVPVALRFGDRFASWAFDAEPSTSSRTHSRLGIAVAKASTSTMRVRWAVIDAPWMGAVALANERDTPTIALTTSASELEDGPLDALVRSAIREIRVDGPRLSARRALSLPIVAIHAGARSLRWRANRVGALVPILGVPAVLAIPSGTSAATFVPTVAALMVAASMGLLVAFAVSGLWVRGTVAISTTLFGQVTADPFLPTPHAEGPAAPLVVRALVHQPGRRPGTHRLPGGRVPSTLPQGEASRHLA